MGDVCRKRHSLDGRWCQYSGPQIRHHQTVDGSTVESTDGASTTILDAGGTVTNLVSFESGEGADSVLRGFTLRNSGERAIYVSGAGPTLVDLVVEDVGAVYGAGLYVTGGTPSVSDSTFSAIDGTLGSDIYVDAASDVVVSACAFANGTSSEGELGLGRLLATLVAACARRPDGRAAGSERPDGTCAWSQSDA